MAFYDKAETFSILSQALKFCRCRQVQVYLVDNYDRIYPHPDCVEEEYFVDVDEDDDEERWFTLKLKTMDDVEKCKSRVCLRNKSHIICRSFRSLCMVVFDTIFHTVIQVIQSNIVMYCSQRWTDCATRRRKAKTKKTFCLISYICAKRYLVVMRSLQLNIDLIFQN